MEDFRTDDGVLAVAHSNRMAALWEAAVNELDDLRDKHSTLQFELQMAREALEAMLAHSCVADTDADDKCEEDHAAERKARAALGARCGTL